MANCFSEGRRAIFESLAEVCDRIEEGMRAELSHDRQEIEQLRIRLLDTERLELENKELRSHIQRLQRKSVAPETPQPSKTTAPRLKVGGLDTLPDSSDTILPPTPELTSVDTRTSLQGPRDDIDWKLQAARNAAKYTRLQVELKTAIDMLAKRKEERDKWKHFAERLQKRIQLLEARLTQGDLRKLDSTALAEKTETESLIDPVVTAEPRSPNVQTSRPQRRSRKGLDDGVGALAEDGANYGPSPPNQIATPRTNCGSSRLTSLLSGASKPVGSPVIKPSFQKPGTPRSLLQPPTAPQPRTTPDAAPAWLQTPQPRELPFDRITGEKTKSTPKQTPRRKAGPSSAIGSKPDGIPHTAQSRIRAKALSLLQLDDFKINPAFNGGHDFAYSEVVRNKEERAGLPGCVDMDCCGKGFRAMALAERGNGRRTAEQLVEDRKLLEQFLGDERHRLFSMTKEERVELWVKAKTQELANRIGTHRHRFGRMKSPPGFWRTDFPETQELEEDRAQAARQEREMIQERYQEAVRPGGKWIFRDELVIAGGQGGKAKPSSLQPRINSGLNFAFSQGAEMSSNWEAPTIPTSSQRASFHSQRDLFFVFSSI
ncbi:unnamed protein product [Parascedosporium putredinis]|uniref:DNA endonuclease activator Ctp1 C-terminal domain-containing protein n=1 Tax=Parascedosporium putredinis TaxID=1442378 RepID=A0A9P1H3C5_9PEZI|nr:unnamed protein product [Parascedosporium putredinis]CAI7995751.1 unnamed protein product [Parascedosporium putredinis]